MRPGGIKLGNMSVSLKRTPAGVCDQRGRFLWWLHAVGMRCFHCQEGTFVHRVEWRFSECGCDDPFCKNCFGSGVRASRIADRRQNCGPESR